MNTLSMKITKKFKLITLFREHISLFVLLSAIGLSACQEEIGIDNDQIDSSIIEYNGLTLNHTFSTPVEALYYSTEKYESMYKSKFAINDYDESTWDHIPSLTSWANISEKCAEKYPDFLRMNERDIELIKSNFSNMSDEEIVANLDTIEEYYNKNLQYDVFSNIKKQNIEVTVESDNFSKLCGAEKRVLISATLANSRLPIMLKAARDNTVTITNRIYTSEVNRTQSNAFKHALWNALSAKYCAVLIKDISKGVSWAGRITDAHEECGREDGNPEYDVQMDLHNNLVGREYLKSVAELKTRRRRFWFTKKWVEAPNDNVIADALKTRADNAQKASMTVASVRAVARNRMVFLVD